MPIVLRTYGTDSNPAGSSGFVGIPRPVGVVDGDTVLVAITIPAANVVVTPSDAEWLLLTQTDPTNGIRVLVYWRVALNEPDNWVFALSSPAQAAAVVAVYGNCDLTTPVQVSAIALSASGTTQYLPGVTASDTNQELVVFPAAAASGTFAPAGALVSAARKQQSAATIEFQHQPLQFAGVIAPFTETFSTAAAGAAVVLLLQPSTGTLSVDDARNRLVAGLPIGADAVYDLTPNGDYFKLFNASAMSFKVLAYDYVDMARAELVPDESFYKLIDWEKIFGIEYSNIVRFGTIPQRRAQVLSEWRAAAGQGSSIPAVQGVLAAILGYSPGTTVQVVECDRVALTEAHTYAAPTTTCGSGETSIAVPVHDGGNVSSAGARLFLTCGGTGQNLVVTLIAPDGTNSDPFGIFASTASQEIFYADMAGVPVSGVWLVSIDNLGSSVDVTVGLFVEGVQDVRAPPLQATACAIFDWGVYADPAHMGENGAQADLTAARRALQEMAFAHTTANILQSLAPWPDTGSGPQAAIPDECIPT